VTTIAWDGKTLAADRQANMGSSRSLTRKLYDCSDYIYGAAGDVSEVERIAEWLASGAKSSRRVVLEEHAYGGIAIRKTDGRCFDLVGKVVVLSECLDKFCAAGSGHCYARAAMAMGKTAVQAVTFASRFDVYTGLGVDSIRLRRK